MLTRPRRQLAATLALTLFTIAPTAYVGVTVRALGRPAHLRSIEAEIGRRLGVLVDVNAAAHPRPDVDALNGVSLRLDDAGHAEIARADTLRISHEGSDLTLRAGHLVLSGDSAADALATVVTLMRRMSSAETSRINLVADQCDLRLGSRVEALRDLAAIVRIDRTAPSLSVTYLIGQERRRCEAAIRCEAGSFGGSIAVSLKTTDGPISARVLAPFFDTENWLGGEATLEGTLELTRTGVNGWDAKFRGELTNVDLAAVVERRFAGQRLAGEARITFETAHWGERPDGQGPGWIEARGRLTSGPGSISAGLLESLRSQMQFRLSERPNLADQPDVEFQGMGLAFAMTAVGELSVKGAMGPEYAHDAVIVQGNHTQPLARAPEGVANVRGLWNMLIPASADTLAPAVPESQPLRWLPLPRRTLAESWPFAAELPRKPRGAVIDRMHRMMESGQ
jgi:hypothetical protein